MEPDIVRTRLELLVGAKQGLILAPGSLFETLCARVATLDEVSPELLGQLLLAAGLNQPSADFHAFFRSLAGDTYKFDHSLDQWRKLCMLHFGNFRYPYREFSSASAKEIRRAFPRRKRNVSTREPRPIDAINEIAAKDTPFLGYMAGKSVREIQSRKQDGGDVSPHEETLLKRYESAQKSAHLNSYEYCTMPHLDVYVATSMRDYEDFIAVHRFTRELFDDDRLAKVAYFDPTQSDHPDRIAKGIIEALMLRRAAATVYLAQEKETLGKDSELAATLAQGKVVVAYVPRIDNVDDLAVQLRNDALDANAVDAPYPGEDGATARLLDRAKRIDPELWFTLESRQRDTAQPDIALDEVAEHLAKVLRVKYEEKAENLLSVHPLGIQVRLDTGVANGLLVARTQEQCRELIIEILNDQLQFRIEARAPDGQTYPDSEAPLDYDRLLRECRTESVHRVVIGDEIVSNSFWNWYPEQDILHTGLPSLVIGSKYSVETGSQEDQEKM